MTSVSIFKYGLETWVTHHNALDLCHAVDNCKLLRRRRPRWRETACSDDACVKFVKQSRIIESLMQGYKNLHENYSYKKKESIMSVLTREKVKKYSFLCVYKRKNKQSFSRSCTTWSSFSRPSRQRAHLSLWVYPANSSRRVNPSRPHCRTFFSLEWRKWI